MTAALAETDLYQPLYDYLVAQGYTVRGEVHHCDIAAVKDGNLVIIELKRNLSLTLLAQAVRRQRHTDTVYMAIPRPVNMRKWRGQMKATLVVLRRLELGLLLVATTPGKRAVEVVQHPEPCPVRQRRGQRAILEEIAQRSGDFNRGGSCRTTLVTAYRERAIHIAVCLVAHGTLTPRQLRKLGTAPKTLAILYRNVYGWFDHPTRGSYALNACGQKALEQYPELVGRYREMIGDKHP